jgi:hypothetical protein
MCAGLRKVYALSAGTYIRGANFESAEKRYATAWVYKLRRGARFPIFSFLFFSIIRQHPSYSLWLSPLFGVNGRSRRGNWRKEEYSITYPLLY